MKIYRVNEVWQLALVYQVRIKDAEFLKITLESEFNEEYGKNYSYILAADDELGLGTLRINFDNKEYAKIERVAVIPDYQNQGIGRKMMEGAERWIKDSGYNKVIIHSKYSASGFYEKLNYLPNKNIKLALGPDSKHQVYFSKNLD